MIEMKDECHHFQTKAVYHQRCDTKIFLCMHFRSHIRHENIAEDGHVRKGTDRPRESGEGHLGRIRVRLGRQNVLFIPGIANTRFTVE